MTYTFSALGYPGFMLRLGSGFGWLMPEKREKVESGDIHLGLARYED